MIGKTSPVMLLEVWGEARTTNAGAIASDPSQGQSAGRAQGSIAAQTRTGPIPG